MCKQFLLKQRGLQVQPFFFLPLCPTKHDPLPKNADAVAPNLSIASLSAMTAFLEVGCSECGTCNAS